MFFRFILIVIIISYILYLLAKWWLKRKIRNIEKDYNEQQEAYQSMNKKEGDVTVKTKAKNKKNYKDSEGEYVDFEEVE
jgi:cytochrome b subunit of formate dehydrogenase